MSDERKQLPSNMFVNDAIFDIKAAINAVDVRSISALKDLTNAFNSNTKRINILQKEIASTEEDVKELSAAVEHNTQEVDKISNSQQRVLHEIQNLSRDFEGQIEKLGTNIDGKISQLRDGIEKVKDEVSKNASSGGTNIIPIMGRGGAKAATTGAAVVAKEATVASKALSGIPSLVKGLSRGIGGLIAGFAANLGEQYAEAAGMPRLGAAFGIGGDALTGAAIGGLLGSIIPVLGTAAGAWAGGALGGAYGAYDKGGQLLGGELSPQVKALQEQAQQRQEAHDREQESLKQLYKEKPELEKFPRGAGVPPEVIAEPTSGAPDTGRKLQGPSIPYKESNAFFDSIIKAEGTGSKGGNPYDTSLGYMKSPKPLTQMTMDESLAWGDQIRVSQGLNSSAKGAFQIVNTTQRAAMRALGLKGSDPFNEENQRKMAAWIAQKQGLGAWEGFKSHPDQRAIASQSMESGLHNQTASVVEQQTTTNPVSPLPNGEQKNNNAEVTPNGQIPKQATRDEKAITGKSLEGVNPSLVSAFMQAASEFKQRTGQIVNVTSALRSRADQERLWANRFSNPNPVAPPGSSNHEKGLAIDVSSSTAAAMEKSGVLSKYGLVRPHSTDPVHIELAGSSGSQDSSQSSKGSSASYGPQQQTLSSPMTPQQIPQMPQQPIPMSPIGGMGGMGAMGMNPMSMMGMMGGMGGMGRFGGMASMLTGMLGPMLGGMMGGGMPDMMSGAQLQPNQPQMAGLVPPINIEAPPINPIGMESPAEEYQQSVNNNFNIMGGSQKGVSTATPQNHLTMGARPDWLGELAEGLLGSTYTGMSRPKYFGAGTGKM